MTYISDHAVLRYLERHYGLNVEGVRAEMQTPTFEIEEEFGCERVIRHNVVFVVREGVVTTVLERHMRGRGR